MSLAKAVGTIAGFTLLSRIFGFARDILLARVLGALPLAAQAAPAVQLSSRFALIGVLSGRASGGGAALIAVDGKPAKPFRVGATVDEGLVVQALGPRQAQLGPAVGEPATLTLDMPLLKR